jgi:hypothetical protein
MAGGRQSRPRSPIIVSSTRVAVSPIRLNAFVRAEPEGTDLKLVFIDDCGGTVILRLPLACLGDLLCSLPAQPPPATSTVAEVRAWRLDGPEAGGSGLTLTSQTAEGQSSVFRLSQGQIAGMATLAMHAQPASSVPRNLH